jgi:hypothetical protein
VDEGRLQFDAFMLVLFLFLFPFAFAAALSGLSVFDFFENIAMMWLVGDEIA